MHFLESELLILLGLYDPVTDYGADIDFYSNYWVLFQLLMAPIVIDFFPKESILYDGLNILSEVDETVWYAPTE